MKFFCPECAQDFVAETDLVKPVECPGCTTHWEIDSQGPNYAWITSRSEAGGRVLVEH